jgi:uncharacterized protein YjeT (DUF2065 family)
MSHPWPKPQNESQVALHNARVAITVVEDHLQYFASSEWKREVFDALSLADEILRGAFDKADREDQP